MLKDTFRVLRQYQALAPENARSLWPIYGFWLFSIPALCAGAATGLYFNLPSTSANNVSAHFPSTSVALWWVSVSSFLIAYFPAGFLVTFRIMARRCGAGNGGVRTYIHGTILPWRL